MKPPRGISQGGRISMRRPIPLTIVALAAFVIGFGLWKTREPFKGWQQRLAESPTLTLYSLEPEPQYWPRNTPKNAPKISESLILGSTVIMDAKDKKQLLAAIDQMLAQKIEYRTACVYSPRHALESADKRTLLVACFECGQGSVTSPLDSRSLTPFLPLAAPVFNSMLRKHGVPLSDMGKTKFQNKGENRIRSRP